MPLSVKQKIALGAILLLVIVQYGLIPLYDWQESVTDHIQKLNRSIAKKKDLLSRTGDIQESWQQAQIRIQEIERYYQSGFSDMQALQLGLQKKVEKICSDEGIKILNLDWLPVADGDVIQVPIKLRMEAQPGKLYRFLCDLENDAFFHSIDIMRITSRANAEALMVDVDLASYGIKSSGKSGKG